MNGSNDKTIYNFYNVKNGKTFKGMQSDFRKENKLSKSVLADLMNNNIKRTRCGWYYSTNNKYNIFYILELHNIKAKRFTKQLMFKRCKEVKKYVEYTRQFYNVPDEFTILCYAQALRYIHLSTKN